MLANISPVLLPLTPGVGSNCHFFFSESSYVAYQINGNEVKNTMQANFLPSCVPSTPGCVGKVKAFFSEEGFVAYYQIKGKECRQLCN